MDYIIIILLVILIVLVIFSLMKNINEAKITERLGKLEVNMIVHYSAGLPYICLYPNIARPFLPCFLRPRIYVGVLNTG